MVLYGKVLLEIGEWLKVNGEAIYDSSTWRIYGEGPTQIVEGQFADGIKKNFTSEDFRFTRGHGYLYAIVMKTNEKGEYCIKSLGVQDISRQANFGGIIDDVTVLGYDGEVKFERGEEGLKIYSKVQSDRPVTFKIKLR